MRNYRELFRHDLRSLFRTSVLITGSVESAECALIDAIRVLSVPGQVLSREEMAFAVAQCSVGVLQLAKFASDSVSDSALILVADELRPVFGLPPDLRCCFVLRTLMGYSREQVASIMNIKSENVETLAQNALIQFATLADKRGDEAARFPPGSSFLKDANPIQNGNRIDDAP
jgi:Sigma-70, region 4